MHVHAHRYLLKLFQDYLFHQVGAPAYLPVSTLLVALARSGMLLWHEVALNCHQLWILELTLVFNVSPQSLS